MDSQDYLHCKTDLSKRGTIWFHCLKAVGLCFADKKKEMREQRRHPRLVNISCVPSTAKQRLKIKYIA